MLSDLRYWPVDVVDDFCYHHKRLWWLAGYKVCYADNGTGGFCKRRSYHLGEHRTSAGRKGTRWPSKLRVGHSPGNCRCGTYHPIWEC